MPMPPPNPSSEPAPRRRQRREIEQISRALTALGPADRDTLADAVGAAYWEPGRFDRALAAAVSSGRLVIDADSRYVGV
jgi:hypothetical protein